MQSGEPLRGGRLPACALDSQNTRFVVRLERQKAREQRRRRASGCNAGAYLQKKSAEAGVAGRCFFCHGFRSKASPAVYQEVPPERERADSLQ